MVMIGWVQKIRSSRSGSGRVDDDGAGACLLCIFIGYLFFSFSSCCLIRFLEFYVQCARISTSNACLYF